MMKIAYINYQPSRGVYNKLLAFGAAARNLGLPLDIFVLSDEYPERCQGLELRRLNFPRQWLLRKLAINFNHYHYIYKSVDLSKYERIILRYPGALNFSFLKFFKLYKGKIIVEYHSDPIGELKILEEGILNPWRILMERLNSPQLLSRAIGMICVTNELEQKYQKQSKKHIPSVVISNGVDVGSINFTGYQSVHDDYLNLLFMASTFSPWHGLDRLLKGLILYNGNSRINLFLVGNVESEQNLSLMRKINNPNVKITRTGQLIGDELDKLFKESNLAVSSLAIFRNNISEACVLKTREYIARGIPFIYAYDDVDLTGEEVFAKKMSCDDQPLDISEIISFAVNVSQRKDVSEIMRDFAVRKLDWKNKVVKMVEFAESTLKKKSDQ